MMMKPRMNPARGDVIIGTRTFQSNPLPSHQWLLSGTAQTITCQLLWAAASEAPHKPPMSAWLELEGRPNHQVNKFQKMAPMSAQMMRLEEMATSFVSMRPPAMVLATA